MFVRPFCAKERQNLIIFYIFQNRIESEKKFNIEFWQTSMHEQWFCVYSRYIFKGNPGNLNNSILPNARCVRKFKMNKQKTRFCFAFQTGFLFPSWILGLKLFLFACLVPGTENPWHKLILQMKCSFKGKELSRFLCASHWILVDSFFSWSDLRKGRLEPN